MSRVFIITVDDLDTVFRVLRDKGVRAIGEVDRSHEYRQDRDGAVGRYRVVEAEAPR